MKSFFILLMALAASTTALAGLSPVRHSNETYEAASKRSRLSLSYQAPQDFLGRTTPERAKKPMTELNLQEIPDVGSYADLEREFKYVRDTRFITDVAPMARRLTWMYPDDGCYARAEMASIALIDHNFTAPKKIFVFGNLKALTKNSPYGSVQWWYHVAVTYRVGAEAYVFDPSIEPAKPLTLKEWNKAVGGESSYVKYAICSGKTYDPGSDCMAQRGLPVEEALSEQKSFLSPEWSRLVELHRSPEKELGNEPPWLK